MKKTEIDVAKEQLESLSAEVKAYGEGMLDKLGKRLGEKPAESDTESLLVYYDKMLVFIARAKGKLVGLIASQGKGGTKSTDGLGDDEKWLFFHRYEMYLTAIIESLKS